MQLEVCLKQNLILLWVGSSPGWPKVVTANLHYSVTINLLNFQSTFLPFTETLQASSFFALQSLLRQITIEEAGNMLRNFLLLLFIISLKTEGTSNLPWRQVTFLKSESINHSSSYFLLQQCVQLNKIHNLACSYVEKWVNAVSCLVEYNLHLLQMNAR